MEELAFFENLKMQENLNSVANSRAKPPFKLLEAVRHLHRKKALTASDLAHMMDTSRDNAAALLKRLEALGFATSELAKKERILIYDFRWPE